jgi:ribosomal protein S18 acetylase RimI-like enzyme
MAGETDRPYAGPADLQVMIDLLVDARPVERAADFPSVSDLHELLNVSEYRANTRLWEDAAGQLAGFSFLLPRTNSIYFEIAPQSDADEVAIQMVTWATGRVRAAGGASDENERLRSGCREENADRIALLERLGFEQRSQRTVHLARDLRQPIPEPQLPEGYTVRHSAGESEVEELVALHQAAFGTQNVAVEGRLSWMQVPEYEPELDLLAVAPDGSLAAYVFCAISQEENKLTGRNDGYTDPVGTHPDHQRRGLAKALLLTGLRMLKERGVDTARISTGDSNAAMLGAAKAVGYREVGTTLFFVKWPVIAQQKAQGSFSHNPESCHSEKNEESIQIEEPRNG